MEKRDSRRFFATTAKGMEPLLAAELRSFNASDITDTRPGVSFTGSLEVAYRACLWSRIANRILLPLKTFSAPAPEKLYAGVKSIRWSDHMTAENTLAVDFSSSHSKITHTHFGALKVKDAVVDQFRSIQGIRPSVDPIQPDIRINVYLLKDEATVSLDLSGDSLHKRGYREQGAPAPLKENLAAAILSFAEWTGKDRDTAFLDPMCGSGTLPIEAALIATNTAPGLNRKYYGFLNWKDHDQKLWAKLLDEARAKVVTDRKQLPRIVGYDTDFRAVRTALANVEQAGLRGIVHIEKRDLALADRISEKGLIVVNPPYGERLGEEEALKPLYKALGDTFKQKFRGWRGFIFTGSPALSKCIGLKPSRRFILFNGAIECRLFKFDLY